MTVDTPAWATALIDTIILGDEGGWVVTKNKDDPDGGWTFGGMTRKTLQPYFNNDFPNHDFDVEWQAMENDHKEDFVREAYYDLFVLPLQLDKLPNTLKGPLLSCAVNIGVKEAVVVLQTCLKIEQDGILGSKTFVAMYNYNSVIGNEHIITLKDIFLHQWQLHYADLVRANAEAWRDFANFWYNASVTSSRQDTHPVKPTTLRATNLAGWLNRIERWRNV